MGENDLRAMPSAPATPEPSPAVSALRGGIGIAAHTPGPWRMTHTGFLGVGILPSTGELRTEGGPIITCWSACIGNAETEANARLIAAAPALYEALEDFDNWFCGFNPEDQASRMEGRKVVIRARAALNLARGAA